MTARMKPSAACAGIPWRTTSTRATAGGVTVSDRIPINANVTCGSPGSKGISETMISTGGSLRSWRSCGGQMKPTTLDMDKVTPWLHSRATMHQDRGEWDIRLEFCSECWAKVLAIIKGGLPQARKLWREMHYEKEERKIHSILDREGVNGGKAR